MPVLPERGAGTRDRPHASRTLRRSCAADRPCLGADRMAGSAGSRRCRQHSGHAGAGENPASFAHHQRRGHLPLHHPRHTGCRDPPRQLPAHPRGPLRGPPSHGSIRFSRPRPCCGVCRTPPWSSLPNSIAAERMQEPRQHSTVRFQTVHGPAPPDSDDPAGRVRSCRDRRAAASRPRTRPPSGGTRLSSGCPSRATMRPCGPRTWARAPAYAPSCPPDTVCASRPWTCPSACCGRHAVRPRPRIRPSASAMCATSACPVRTVPTMCSSSATWSGTGAT